MCSIAALLGCAFGSSAHAQAPFQPGDTRVYEIHVTAPGPHYGKRPVPPLAPAQKERFQRARALGDAGRLDAARDTLARLLSEMPHHPLLLVETARLQETRRAWRAIETLARTERASLRDSLLLAQELVNAIARQGRARDAAQVVLEAWVAEPLHLDWARDWLDTLVTREPRGVRELVRRAASTLPRRDDLALVAARLEWRYGDVPAAMQLLADADVPGRGIPARWAFAEEMLVSGGARDSAGAVEALLGLAADRAHPASYRASGARRAWDIASRLGGTGALAPRIARALGDLPADQWGRELAVGVLRGLRENGLPGESRALLGSLGRQGFAIPEIALERTLGDLRDGPPETALPALRALADTLPEAAFGYAEALFFAGQSDSALAWYRRVASDPAAPRAGAALERIYLIEDGQPREGLVEFGRLSYEHWRGEPRRARAIADSLFLALSRGPLWAHVALALASLREASGEGKSALGPLLAVADSLPDDRLASLARQRAGDVLRVWYKDDARALAQYEECLARYPRAWNTPEVRRWVEFLRRERRF